MGLMNRIGLAFAYSIERFVSSLWFARATFLEESLSVCIKRAETTKNKMVQWRQFIFVFNIYEDQPKSGKWLAYCLPSSIALCLINKRKPILSGLDRWLVGCLVITCRRSSSADQPAAETSLQTKLNVDTIEPLAGTLIPYTPKREILFCCRCLARPSRTSGKNQYKTIIE